MEEELAEREGKVGKNGGEGGPLALVSLGH